MSRLWRHKTLVLAFFVASALGGGAAVIVPQKALAAPCTMPSTDYGVATMNVNIPSTGSYRIWSRMVTPNATDNSYLLEINNNCYVVGDGTFNQTNWNANASNWVDYQNGTVSNKITPSLPAGNHTVRLIGNAPNVQLDRVIFTSDTSCIPTGTGDNCASPPDTWNPTVSITSPSNGSTQTGTVTIQANAADDVNGSGINRVEFLVDGQVVGSDNSQPYSHNLNTGTLSVGNHNLTARAFDNNGNSATSSVVVINVQRPPDTTNPTVSITGPANGSTQTGTITVSANASDNVGVSRVEFTIGGQVFATDNSSPYSVQLNTNNYTNGSHALRAIAYDAAGNSGQSSQVSITINNVTTPPPDTTPPTISLTNPTTGSRLSGTVNMQVNYSDNVAVTRVQFLVDGQVVNNDTTPPFTYALNTTTLSNANHNFQARAYDVAGNNRLSTAVTARVENRSIIAEDVNENGTVDINDFTLLVASFGRSGSNLGRADIDGNGIVDINDFTRLVSRFGHVAQ